MEKVHEKRKVDTSGAATKVATSGSHSNIANIFILEEGTQFSFMISPQSVIEAEHFRLIKIKESKHVENNHS